MELSEHIWSAAGFVLMFLLGFFALFINLCAINYKLKLDRGCFWFFGIALVIFAAFRPIGLARDDFGYAELLNELCPNETCFGGKPIQRDFIWYHLVIWSAHLSLEGMLRVSMMLSAFGVAVKLILIDKLCQQRLLALVLFVPLCYIQYDLTQMRAGFAITWMLLGVFFLVRSKMTLATGLLFTNAAVHLQAVFSPMLLIYKVFRGRCIGFVFSILFFLLLIYSGLYPDGLLLKRLGFNSEYIPYTADFTGVSVFPLGYWPILLYGIFVCNTHSVGNQKLREVVSASLFVAIALAWLFALLPAMQTRLFEFYAVPLVFLAGNVGDSRVKITLTCLLALTLYLRLELFNDWVLG